MDPVQVPVVSTPANSFGLLLIGVGLLCLGLGVGWWWMRTTHKDEESRGDGTDSSTNNEDEIPGDTGAFVFGTGGGDSESVDKRTDGSNSTDTVDHQE
ncbi:hypothetical protein [Halocatena pleomorpha]|uniref:Uncharacterized protein n=1 Tax=Halocatena pleomorpha TaxID=1785090 RepID=A0A3P3RC64_9EURY|nr:hypothetical protein [Halocatena pleomorpha]RRJ30063.1 hypothetical protein EIK79_10780 [Halocatena pleomorpha]